MHPRPTPQTAYARVAFDARVASASPAELVHLCYEQLIAALGAVLIAAERGDNARKSEALTRAVSVLTALQLGVTSPGGISDALSQVYTSARHAVLDSVLAFDGATIATIRGDFIEISAALAA